jgi:predicted O-methyltransferase YrrM
MPLGWSLALHWICRRRRDQMMSRVLRVFRLFVCAVAALAAVPAAAQSREQRAVLDAIKQIDRDQLSVSEEDGRFLRVAVTSAGTKRALEIGGALGYSAIWIALGLRETGGHLTSIEADANRAKIAADNVRRAGLADTVTVVAGDAFKEIPKLGGDVDFVFLDAWKRDYKRFLDLVLPRLTAHGVFLAHNVVNKRSEMADFLAAIEHNPNLFTTIVSPAGEGISISVKLR